MKKRIVCVLLTLIMLLGLIPMGASAASHEVSEAAITVLKQMTTFKNKCYHYSGSEFRTGYGTVCEEKHSFGTDGKPKKDASGNIVSQHTITQANADTALRKALVGLDEKVCAFETANGLSLTQNQHDALVVFSYNAGTGWMSGNGVLKSVIINKGDANEMLNAMTQWSIEASNGNITDRSRREVEVNMYMNGVYSNTAPTSYGWVKYDANKGDMPQSDSLSGGLYTYYYDLYQTIAHPVVPTRAGYKFLGWYVNYPNNPAWSTSLTKSMDGTTLTALWQEDFIPVEVDYQLHRDHLVSTKVYTRVGDAKSNEDLTKAFKENLEDYGKLFYVDRDLIDVNGTRWSRLSGNKGWVKVGAQTDNESTTDSYGTVIATATVTAKGYLNLRKEAGTDSTIVGALAKNDTVNIYEIKTVNGHQWGRSKSGWLCLTYTRVIMKDDVSISDEGRLAYTFTGSAVGGDVQVHVEPGDNTNFVTYYDPDGDLQTAAVKKGRAVTVTNLAVYKSSETWAKITWMNDEWEYTDDEGNWQNIKVKRSGWVKLVPVPAEAHIDLDSVTYTVVADSVNVRDNWGDSANLVFTLNKGVQVKVNLVALVGENIWGRVKVKRAEHVDDETVGYVNLASKYFTRDDVPVVEEEESNGKLIATVINTDALRVRKYGATYGIPMGTLSRGTIVAVWDVNDDGWYKVDSNQNGVYDEKDDGWCYGDYLDVQKDTSTSTNTVTDNAGNKYQTDGTGKGIVANTYSGVNVRTGPSTGYAATGKLLPGTVVEILETANARKWGRVAQGWVSMDYVTMMSYNEVVDETQNNGTTVESFDKAEKTTTTAVYTGRIVGDTSVYRNPTKDEENAEFIRNASAGENVTIYELAKVTEVVHSDDEVNGNVTTNTTVTTTTYWARINDGWVENPEDFLALNALDEKIHTQTGVSKLNVRKGYDDRTANEAGEVFDILVQGDQVSITALDVIDDKVWGRVDTSEGTGWIRLDYMSEGEVYVKAPVQNNTNNNTNQIVLGQGSSTGGYVNNTSGYRYTGKVIRTNSLNVRQNPSDTANKVISLTSGQAMVIYETTTVDGMAWGRCDAGWVYLYYVDLTPVTGAVDARVVANDNTIIYSDMNCTSVAGTYAKQAVVDIFEIVGKMARTEQGWISTDNLL